jgi:ABC-type glycerol-3-phosphate transport system substrate-binding protein
VFWSSKTNSVYTDRKEHRWERDAGSGNADSPADSQNKEAAYLFVQWLQSPENSGERVKLQYALRDPYRESHFNDEGYQSLWPEAPQYLEVLRKGAETGVHDLGLPGARANMKKRSTAPSPPPMPVATPRQRSTVEGHAARIT